MPSPAPPLPRSSLSITLALASPSDAPLLASLTTAAFSASDAAYPLIWGSAPPGTHDAAALMGLFTPLQKEDRVVWKATVTVRDEDGDGGKKKREMIVGVAGWMLPKGNEGGGGGVGGAGGLPNIPGVNMKLWTEKFEGPKRESGDKIDREKDMSLSVLFIHPAYQRQGIGSRLLQWGMKTADEKHARIWLTSTPQAVGLYKRNEWKVVDVWEIDLGEYGGSGSYRRARMVRFPGGAGMLEFSGED